MMLRREIAKEEAISQSLHFGCYEKRLADDGYRMTILYKPKAGLAWMRRPCLICRKSYKGHITAQLAC